MNIGQCNAIDDVFITMYALLLPALALILNSTHLGSTKQTFIKRKVRDTVGETGSILYNQNLSIKIQFQSIHVGDRR